MKHDDNDERDEREMPSPGWEERIEAAYLRIQAGLPPVPWLPNLPTLTRLRRQVRRARAGVIAPGNPRIPVRAWADTLEQGIVMNVLEREELRKQIATTGCSSDGQRIRLADRRGTVQARAPQPRPPLVRRAGNGLRRRAARPRSGSLLLVFAIIFPLLTAATRGHEV